MYGRKKIRNPNNNHGCTAWDVCDRSNNCSYDQAFKHNFLEDFKNKIQNLQNEGSFFNKTSRQQKEYYCLMLRKINTLDKKLQHLEELLLARMDNDSEDIIDVAGRHSDHGNREYLSFYDSIQSLLSLAGKLKEEMMCKKNTTQNKNHNLSKLYGKINDLEEEIRDLIYYFINLQENDIELCRQKNPFTSKKTKQPINYYRITNSTREKVNDILCRHQAVEYNLGKKKNTNGRCQRCSNSTNQNFIKSVPFCVSNLRDDGNNLPVSTCRCFECVNRNFNRYQFKNIAFDVESAVEVPKYDKTRPFHVESNCSCSVCNNNRNGRRKNTRRKTTQNVKYKNVLPCSSISSSNENFFMKPKQYATFQFAKAPIGKKCLFGSSPRKSDHCLHKVKKTLLRRGKNETPFYKEVEISCYIPKSEICDFKTGNEKVYVHHYSKNESPALTPKTTNKLDRNDIELKNAKVKQQHESIACIASHGQPTLERNSLQNDEVQYQHFQLKEQKKPKGRPNKKTMHYVQSKQEEDGDDEEEREDEEENRRTRTIEKRKKASFYRKSRKNNNGNGSNNVYGSELEFPSSIETSDENWKESKFFKDLTDQKANSDDTLDFTKRNQVKKNIIVKQNRYHNTKRKAQKSKQNTQQPKSFKTKHFDHDSDNTQSSDCDVCYYNNSKSTNNKDVKERFFVIKTKGSLSSEENSDLRKVIDRLKEIESEVCSNCIIKEKRTQLQPGKVDDFNDKTKIIIKKEIIRCPECRNKLDDNLFKFSPSKKPTEMPVDEEIPQEKKYRIRKEEKPINKDTISLQEEYNQFHSSFRSSYEEKHKTEHPGNDKENSKGHNKTIPVFQTNLDHVSIFNKESVRKSNTFDTDVTKNTETTNKKKEIETINIPSLKVANSLNVSYESNMKHISSSQSKKATEKNNHSIPPKVKEHVDPNFRQDTNKIRSIYDEQSEILRSIVTNESTEQVHNSLDSKRINQSYLSVNKSTAGNIGHDNKKNFKKTSRENVQILSKIPPSSTLEKKNTSQKSRTGLLNLNNGYFKEAVSQAEVEQQKDGDFQLDSVRPEPKTLGHKGFQIKGACRTMQHKKYSRHLAGSKKSKVFSSRTKCSCKSESAKSKSDSNCVLCPSGYRKPLTFTVTRRTYKPSKSRFRYTNWVYPNTTKVIHLAENTSGGNETQCVKYDSPQSTMSSEPLSKPSDRYNFLPTVTSESSFSMVNWEEVAKKLKDG